MRRLDVPADAAGARLDQFLSAPLGSRTRAQRLIGAGQVHVDGAARPSRHRLDGGESIVVDDRDPRPEPEGGDAPFEVVFEDEHLLVVAKPAGVVVHPARGNRQGTLAQALAGRAAGGPEPWRAGIVHRLDRNTSGLLLVAKADPVHRALKAMLSARRIEREYLALVLGRPPAISGTIDAPLGRDRRSRTRVSTDTDLPREARTHFQTERLLPDATLLRVRLETGRTHQIRAHLQAIGHPVAGDADYGGGSPYGLRRQFLHAARLAFDHPLAAERIDVTSPLPDDLDQALAQAKAGSRNEAGRLRAEGPRPTPPGGPGPRGEGEGGAARTPEKAAHREKLGRLPPLYPPNPDRADPAALPGRRPGGASAGIAAVSGPASTQAKTQREHRSGSGRH